MTDHPIGSTFAIHDPRNRLWIWRDGQCDYSRPIWTTYDGETPDALLKPWAVFTLALSCVHEIVWGCTVLSQLSILGLKAAYQKARGR